MKKCKLLVPIVMAAVLLIPLVAAAGHGQAR